MAEVTPTSGEVVYTPKVLLITGAAGFIGSNATLRILREYPAYKVIVLDKMDYCASINNLKEAHGNPNFTFVKGDIGSADLVNHLLAKEKVDTIINFAAQSHVDNSFGNSITFTENNIVGTHVLLEASRHYGGIKRFIHVSTDEVYGENIETDENEGQFNEAKTSMCPTNPYAATKAGAEMLCNSYKISYNLPIIITRGNNVYGPRQYPEKLIPKFIQLALAGRKFTVHGEGQQMRSYMYVEDVAEAFCFVLHKGVTGEIYNIGTLHERTVMSVASEICKCFGLDPKDQIVHVRDRLFNDARYWMDNSKLRALGWEERTSWEVGFKQTVDWYKAHQDGHWPSIEGALAAHPGDALDEKPFIVPVKDFRVQAPITPVFQRADGKNVFLVFGKTGWLGGEIGQMLADGGHEFQYSKCRLHDRAGIEAEMDALQPTHVISAAGVTGRPNVDWCEGNQVDTLRTNVLGCLNVADICEGRGVHFTNFATGCIFAYDEKHSMGSGVGFTEEDDANFDGSFYSKTKGYVESMLRSYKHTLTLRVRMPIGDDLEFKRNFLFKISHYAKVVNIPNSMTVLPEMMPISLEMAKRRLTGIYNFTNPGVVTHNECLEMYRDYYKKDFTWENFTIEEQDKILAAKRSNNELDCTKLQKEFPEMLGIKESLIKYVFAPQPGPSSPPDGTPKAPPKLGTSYVPKPAYNRADGKKVFLVFGRTGWLGGELGNMLTEGGHEFQFSKCRLHDRAGIEAEIAALNPTHVLSAAGVTGRPNVDWCEFNQVKTLQTNIIGTLNVADICEARGIHFTNFATGCIFEYDDAHKLGSGVGFTEEDTANFDGSFYSKTKGFVEDMLRSYNHVLTLRVRMPIGADLEFPRNFLFKISHYAKIVDIPNSMTVLPEMMPISLEMAKRRLTGIYNFTNPGVVSHNECMEMYKKYYKPDHTWTNFTLEEQDKILSAKRSNNELDCTKLQKEFPEMLGIKESLIKHVFEPAAAARKK